MALQGTWTGAYGYDDGIASDVAFAIEILEEGSGGFKGIVQDGAGGHPMPGEVRGKVDDERIEFLKTMPATLFRFPDGRREVAEGRPQKIAYRGQADGPNAFSGTWTVRGGLKMYGGRVYISRTSHGHWHMSRK